MKALPGQVKSDSAGLEPNGPSQGLSLLTWLVWYQTGLRAEFCPGLRLMRIELVNSAGSGSELTGFKTLI